MDTKCRGVIAGYKKSTSGRLVSSLFSMTLIAVLAIVLAGPSSAARVGSEPCTVVVLCPTTEKDHPFWKLFLDAMQASADSLDMELRVERFQTTRFSLLEAAKRVLLSPNKPDYLLFPYYLEAGDAVLHLAEGAGVHTYLVNADIPCEHKEALGEPGVTFKYWLGGMVPDDSRAGFDLAARLVQVAKRKGYVAEDGKVHVIAVSGTRDTSVACNRNSGMKKALAENGAVLDRLVHAYWEPSLAYEKMSLLLKHKPQATVLWAASDSMAIAARKALREHHLEGAFVVGGIDWSPEGLRAVVDGDMAVSVGGHFMDGARALVCLYDHWNGNRDAMLGMRTSSMWPATAKNVQAVRQFVRGKGWKECDFRQLTLQESGRETYSLSLAELLECTEGEQPKLLSVFGGPYPHH